MAPKEKRALVFAGSLVTACNLHHLDNRPPAAQVVDNGACRRTPPHRTRSISMRAIRSSPISVPITGLAAPATTRTKDGRPLRRSSKRSTTATRSSPSTGRTVCPPAWPIHRPRETRPSFDASATSASSFRYHPSADYTLVGSNDPLGCPEAPSAAGLRMYRRPLPAANSAFLATVMWDGRESQGASVTEDLQHQANDATLLHAQATASLAVEKRASIVAFETALFHARHTLSRSSISRATPTAGRHFSFEEVLPGFQPGINAPFEPGFTSVVFTLYEEWELAAPSDLARSIGRGEIVFNTKAFTIDGVAGMNGPDDHSSAPLRGTCGTCHNNPNVGNASSALFLDLGVTGAQPGGGLTVQHLPTYTFRHLESGKTVTLTDPARGLITGRFADLGKTKVPNLRGLTLRAPYFHNGSAAVLSNVIDFYESRFGVGLTSQERSDL